MTSTDRILEQFAAHRDQFPGASLPWLDALRADAIDRFSRRGFPTPKNERWKYTNLRALETTPFIPARRHSLPHGLLPEAVAPHRLVIVGGRVDASLSDAGGLPDGVTLQSLATLVQAEPAWLHDLLEAEDSADHPLLALNTAFLEDGFVLRVDPRVTVPDPIEVLFVDAVGDAAAMIHPRNFVMVGDGADVTLIERHAGADDAAYLRNAATTVRVGQGARLRHYKEQRDGERAFHVARTSVEVGRDATYENFTLQLGASLARNEIDVHLAGTGAHTSLGGAYVTAGKQHVDNTTFIDHAMPHCTSREVYKGVLDDQARGVFQGKILVRQDAQKTDGHQLNRALLLSPTAEIDSKPELEIYADDVKCSHGATTGDLDETQLFYLRARGIPLHEARAMLTQAFLDEAGDEISHEGVRAHFLDLVHRRLNRKVG